MALPKICTRSGTKCLLSRAIVTRLTVERWSRGVRTSVYAFCPATTCVRSIDTTVVGSIAFSAAAAAWAGVYVPVALEARFASAAERTEWLTSLVAEV